MFLGTVTSEYELNYKETKGIFPITRENGNARAVEIACGWERAKYFFVGRVHPEFGSCVFVYEQTFGEKKGYVNPFDTGGLYFKKIPPFIAEDEENCINFLNSTRIPLSIWHDHFQKFLGAYYPDKKNYFRGIKPSISTGNQWGDSKLPFKHNPSDWRCWTWEVRLEEELDILNNLVIFGCTEDVHRGLISKSLRVSGDEQRFLKKLIRSERIEIIKSHLIKDVCAMIEEKMLNRYNSK